MRHILLAHLFQDGLDHGYDDANSGDLKYGTHIYIHLVGTPLS
jgi:hypothetical protein